MLLLFVFVTYFYTADLLSGKAPEDKLMYCERFVEFLIDIEAQLPTRRFFNALLHDSHVLSVSLLSNLNRRKEGKLFSEVK